MIYVLIFTISMMIKGGWLGRIKQWKKWETRRKEIIEDLDTPIHKEFFTNIADWLLDGTQLSSFFLFTGLCAAQPDMLLAGSDDMNLSGFIPATATNTRIRTTSSNMTISYTRGQEVLL